MLIIIVFMAYNAIITRMINRSKLKDIQSLLEQFPAVVLYGPRQVGKTTLAQAVGNQQESVYLDLESHSDRSKLSSPLLYFSTHQNKLVILDEIQYMPNLFQELRGVLDQGRQNGNYTGRFLFLGSASIDLLKQSSESLAGRIAYVELNPLDVSEVGEDDKDRDNLWIRGGFPVSYLADKDSTSVIWRENFIKTYLERDIPQLGPRIPAETLRRFWTMLAYSQGQLLNAAKLARSLAVDGKTVARYLDLMVDLLLVRRLTPYHGNSAKRLVKSPKIYIRDSGLLHTLLGLDNQEAVLSHPVTGDSWEGFVIENILRAAPGRTQAGFYRTTAGAEIDLLLEMPMRGLWAIEIKRSLAPNLERGFFHAREDLNPERCFVIYPGSERYPKAKGVEVIGLNSFCHEL